MRGDIYELKASHAARGHERQDRRYAVILQSDDLPLSTVIAAPTSTSARPARFRPEIDLNGVATRIMIEQMAAVDVETRLGAFVGRLGTDDLRRVEAALRIVVALD